MKATESLTLPPVMIDSFKRTVRPENAAGDDFFGLSMGTNGTAAAMRRKMIEVSQQIVNGPLTWERHNGRAAIGLTISVPEHLEESSFVDAWSGGVE